jgi:hypothetical protein
MGKLSICKSATPATSTSNEHHENKHCVKHSLPVHYWQPSMYTAAATTLQEHAATLTHCRSLEKNQQAALHP